VKRLVIDAAKPELLAYSAPSDKRSLHRKTRGAHPLLPLLKPLQSLLRQSALMIISQTATRGSE
jgi:hypothetical protein